MNHVLPATGLRAVIVRLRATKPQKFGFLRHCERAKRDAARRVALHAKGRHALHLVKDFDRATHRVGSFVKQKSAKVGFAASPA